MKLANAHAQDSLQCGPALTQLRERIMRRHTQPNRGSASWGVTRNLTTSCSSGRGLRATRRSFCGVDKEVRTTVHKLNAAHTLQGHDRRRVRGMHSVLEETYKCLTCCDFLNNIQCLSAKLWYPHCISKGGMVKLPCTTSSMYYFL